VAIGIGVGLSDAQTIDSKGIAKEPGWHKKAVDQLNPSPDFLLVIICIS